MRMAPGTLSFLELTAGFWAWLLPTSLVLGLVVLVSGSVWRETRWGRPAFRGMCYLCSLHPNAALVSRRYLRIGVVTVGCFGWWNFVVAPALYGNGHARDFLKTAVAGFDRDYRKENPQADPRRLTASFMVPANVLERDGTRFFLVLPGEADTCPPISNRPGSGALWYTYRIEPKPGARPLRGCPNPRDISSEDVEHVIFASGSPFPIFPAHLVKLDVGRPAGKAQPQSQALVDGGYSNNEPVDAALSVGAEQALIVESSNPLGPTRPVGPARAEMGPGFLMGPLVADLLRLPGFLFERAQQVDRLSRRGLFVVSFSPWREEKDWPFLADFRRPVVERLKNVADADLKRRIGLVESWGLPRFQMSVLVGN